MKKILLNLLLILLLAFLVSACDGGTGVDPSGNLSPEDAAMDEPVPDGEGDLTLGAEYQFSMSAEVNGLIDEMAYDQLKSEWRGEFSVDSDGLIRGDGMVTFDAFVFAVNEELCGYAWTEKGQVVFVNFWATWCAPCREEMPSMQKLYEILPKDKFKMLAILNNDDPALADGFAAKLGLTMPILNDQANTVGPKYGLIGVPETFIINKKGMLVRKFLGPARWDDKRYIDMLQMFIDQ